MKQLAAILETLSPAELRAWVVRQLRGENPAGLRQLYEAPHVPIATIYRFLAPTTRESMQYVIYDLMREIAAGTSVVSAEETFALVDPVFTSSSLQPKVVTLLLSLVAAFDERTPLRHPTLVALLRCGYKGPAGFWADMLRNADDDALMVILEGISEASLAELFNVLERLQWSEYVGDCVASLVPWLIEEYSAERVVPRLMQILAGAPPESRTPVLAIVRPHNVPLPNTDVDWLKAIDSYITGRSDERPWSVFEIGAHLANWKSFADDHADFQGALDDWFKRWSPIPEAMPQAMRALELLAQYPSSRRLIAVIAALDAFRLHGATPEHLPFISTALRAITMNPVALKQLWNDNHDVRKTYERWLEYALGIGWLREPTLRELVTWLDFPDLAPFYRLVADGQMTVNELTEFVRRAAATQATVVRILYEVHQSAIFDERRDIVMALFKNNEGLALQALSLERAAALGSTAALTDYAKQVESQT